MASARVGAQQSHRLGPRASLEAGEAALSGHCGGWEVAAGREGQGRPQARAPSLAGRLLRRELSRAVQDAARGNHGSRALGIVEPSGTSALPRTLQQALARDLNEACPTGARSVAQASRKSRRLPLGEQDSGLQIVLARGAFGIARGG